MLKKTIPPGTVFGKLKVLNAVAPIGGRSHTLCECECGKLAVTRNSRLLDGVTQSCGCWRSELTSIRLTKQATKHGHCKGGKQHPLYSTWDNMVSRCENPRNKNWSSYGGRGIKIHPAWRQNFQNFLDYVGDKPNGTSLDRYPNKDGNYEPGNVRWATQSQQMRNVRCNRIFTVRGVTACMTELASIHGIKPTTVTGRLNRGWGVEAAFTTPTPKRS